MHPFLQLDKKLKIVALKKLFILYFCAVHKILCTFKIANSKELICLT